MIKTIALFVLTASLLSTALARAEPTFAFVAGVFHDSNLTRAQYAADVRSDFAAHGEADVGTSLAPNGYDAFTLAAFARGDVYRRYNGLNNVAVGARGSLRHKFGLGHAAPWISFSLEGSHDDYRDTLRDSNRLQADMEIGMRLSQAFDASAGVMYDRRYDGHGESLVPDIPGTVFDLRGVGGYARAGYAFNDFVYAAVKLGVRRGDVESTAQQSMPIFLVSSAIAADPVFGSNDLFAYRLRATTRTASASGSFALDERSSLNLSYADERTYAAYGNQYRSRLVTLTWSYRQ